MKKKIFRETKADLLKVKLKQDKAVNEIVKLLRENHLTIRVEHEIVIVPIKNKGAIK